MKSDGIALVAAVAPDARFRDEGIIDWDRRPLRDEGGDWVGDMLVDG